MAWIGAVVGAASSYMSAKEGKKQAKEAAKSRETDQYRTPYGNEYIARIFPYLLDNQQKVFENRMRGYGLDPSDFGPVGGMLAGIDQDYSGVGKPGAPKMMSSVSPYNRNPIFAKYRPDAPTNHEPGEISGRLNSGGFLRDFEGGGPSSPALATGDLGGVEGALLGGGGRPPVRRGGYSEFNPTSGRYTMSDATRRAIDNRGKG